MQFLRAYVEVYEGQFDGNGERIFRRNHATGWKESSLRANDRTSNVRLPRVKTKLRCKYIYVVVRKGGHASPCITIPALSFNLFKIRKPRHGTIIVCLFKDFVKKITIKNFLPFLSLFSNFFPKHFSLVNILYN